MSFRPSCIATLLGGLVMLAGPPSWASLVTVADGITYTLNASTISSTEDQFTLQITGINGPGDTEGGRYGVGSLAFNEPVPGSVSTGSLTGFTFMTGGLNAMGCDGTGNFYCFKNNTKPTAPALAPNSMLTFTFDMTLKSVDAGDFANYDPAFKVQWVGTQKHYDLVSQTMTPVPLPAALPLLLGGIAGLGFMRRRKAA